MPFDGGVAAEAPLTQRVPPYRRVRMKRARSIPPPSAHILPTVTDNCCELLSCICAAHNGFGSPTSTV